MASCAFAQDANPVATAAHKQIMERARHVLEAAKEMPADKYSFKATPGQMTFAHLIYHSARGPRGLCAIVAGEKPVPPEGLTDSDPKDKLVAALEQTVTYCDGVLSKLTDKNLGEVLPTPWGEKWTRAELILEMNADQADHYAIAAVYLRLNGLTPPTAKEESCGGGRPHPPLFSAQPDLGVEHVLFVG